MGQTLQEFFVDVIMTATRKLRLVDHFWNQESCVSLRGWTEIFELFEQQVRLKMNNTILIFSFFGGNQNVWH